MAEVKALRENQEKLWEAVKHLQEGQNKLWGKVKDLRKGQEAIRRDVKAIRATLDNVTASIEEEANDVVTHLLKGRVIINSRFEFNIYGTNGQLTIIGEAKTRVDPQVNC